MRGLSPVNSAVCWMSGNQGTIVTTYSGGELWDTVGPERYRSKDFRDIHGYSEHIAIAMSAGEEAVVIRTEDGGRSWKEVLVNNRKGVFLDAMHFSGSYGVIIGDPYTKKSWMFGKRKAYFDLYFSCDSGKTWDCKVFPVDRHLPREGEVLFAASGSNVQFYYPKGATADKPEIAFITGGTMATFYFAGERLDYANTGKSSGPFSMHLNETADTLVIVGGDWRLQDSTQSTAYYAHNDLSSINTSKQAPSGYRSSVARVVNHDGTKVGYVCTGPNGTDFSRDGGITWERLKLPGYNVVAFAGGFVWMVGNDGAFNKLWYFELEGGLPFYNK